ncbi:MAG: hypothetical protein HQ513_02850 [Rhodospirillales bacterium]|nr:hypothetical protein [Rhodospirillales bacterium]
MADPGLKGERMGALFMFGVLLFNPPLLNVFDAGADATIVGIPILFLYLFSVWAILIALMAVVMGKPGPKAGPLSPATDEDSDERRGD